MSIIRPTVLNINKPLNWTSRDVLNKLQSIYNFKKFGHAGTLDPLATGVLLVLVSDETKKQEYYMQLDKVYETIIFFGVSSPTLDLEGSFQNNSTSLKFSKEAIENFLEQQLGVNEQEVPYFSAVKVNGRELYKHARSGTQVKELPKKEVELKSYEILGVSELKEVKDIDLPFLNDTDDYYEKLDYLKSTLPSISLRIKTGKGFYVRSLARDLGKFLKVDSVMGELVRTKVGDFSVKDSLHMNYFEDKPDLV